MADNVWLFYPNLVDYARVVFSLISIEAMTYAPVRASVCYAISAALDAVDGKLAVMFNQVWIFYILATRFGAMMDMLVDRCSLLSLVSCLGHFYPDYMFLFQMSAIIDIASHWLHFHVANVTGKTTHKQSVNPLLHLYYSSRPFLFVMCFGNEAFYGLLYINYFWSGPGLHGYHFIPCVAAIFLPIALLKTFISLLHLMTASKTLVDKDHEFIKRVK